MDYIPKENEIVYVKKIASLCAGGETEEIFDKMNHKIIEECLTVAKTLNIYLAGIDIICADISGSDFKINEVNTAPALGCHIKVVNQEERREVTEEIMKDMFGL